MAYIRKTRGMLRLEKAYGVADIRALLLTSYARHNTIKGVAREYRVSEQTMSAWFRQLGLHTRASLPAQAIPQDLSASSVSTDSGWSGDFDEAGGAAPNSAADAGVGVEKVAEPRFDAAGNLILDAAADEVDDGDGDDDGDDEDFLAANSDDCDDVDDDNDDVYEIPF